MLHLKQGHQLIIQNHEPTQMQLFELRPLDQNLNVKAVRVDFSPINGISQLPKINGDSEFLPFLFISPLEKARLASNEQNGENSTCNMLTEAFRAKLSEAKEEPQQARKVILKPKPFSNYCQICKESFSDYEEHVKHEIHKNKMNQNEFSRHIERLVENYHNSQQKSLKRSRPVCEKKKDSEEPQQLRVKKIVIGKSEFGTVSITKIESELKENQFF